MALEDDEEFTDSDYDDEVEESDSKMVMDTISIIEDENSINKSTTLKATKIKGDSDSAYCTEDSEDSSENS